MEAVEDRELPAGCVDEAEVALVVVAERELVVVALEEPVGLALGIGQRTAELAPPTVPGVVGVRVAAALPLRTAERRGVAGVDGRVAVVGVEIGAALDRVRVRKPSEVMVER